jgi:hypothetical protein
MSNPKPWPFLIKSILRSSFENRLKIDVRIVYGKNELQPEEINWLQKLAYIRTNFCKNLHAKCYINEETCIITSLNLYEFSQINNNNEMGVFLSRGDDIDLYKEAYDEMIHISLEKTSKEPMVSKITRKPRTVVSSLPQN